MAEYEKSRMPWVLCPVCWTPISFFGRDSYEMQKCENSYCAMVFQDLKMHVFNDLASAREFVSETDDEILQGPKELVDFGNRKLALWMVTTFKAPLDRFRLLEKWPLLKLLPGDFIRSWIAGAVSAETSNLFRVYTFSYIRDSGELGVDVERCIISKRVGIEKGKVFCPLCKLIFDKVKVKVKEKRKEEPDYPDPCESCNKALNKKVCDYTEAHKGEMRLITSSPDYKVTLEQMESLSGVCWAGLVSVALPILVADVIVGLGVMGQKRVESMKLTEEQTRERDRILDELGIQLDEYKWLYKNKEIMACKSLEELKKQEYWHKFRENICQVQNLTRNRYGQALSAKAQILVDSIRKWLHEEDIRDFSSEQEIWEKIAPKALEMISNFFSFRQAYIFARENTDKILLVAWWGGQGLPKVGSTTLEGLEEKEKEKDEDIERRILNAVGMRAKSEKKGSPIVVNVDESFWYIFGDRRHTSGRERESFNATCVDLLEKVVKSLHAEIGRILIVQKNLDNVVAMTHNLKGPAAQLANAQVYFDNVVYGEHGAESTAIFREMKYLKDACDILYDSVTFTRKKVEFEANKLRYGRNVELILKNKEFIPILGEERDLSGEPTSFWGKAEESVKTFAGREELSSLKVAIKIVNPFGSNECIYIHPEELQILLDNLSDNAAKYSFESETIEVKLSRDFKIGKDCMLYSISNYGNGIDKSERQNPGEHERKKVGEKFYRGKYSSTRNTRNEGTGLGVYTVRRIVEHVGGSWDWESRYGGSKNYVPGEGFKTTFFVWLPIFKK